MKTYKYQNTSDGVNMKKLIEIFKKTNQQRQIGESKMTKTTLLRNGFCQYSLPNLNVGSRQDIESLLKQVEPELGLDTYIPSGQNARGIVRYTVKDANTHLISPENRQGGQYYVYGLSQQLNPDAGGKQRWFKAITHCTDGTLICNHPVIAALTEFLIQHSIPAPSYHVEHQFIGYYPTPHADCLVTPNTLHFDGLSHQTITSILTLARENVSGGEFVIADGVAVNTPIDNVSTQDLRLFAELPVGSGVIMDECQRGTSRPLCHSAMATRMENVQQNTVSKRIILVSEVTPIWH